MYTTLLWDLDNTLLDFSASEKYALDTCLKHIGIQPTAALLSIYSKTNISYWKMLERGEITKEKLLTQRFVSFFETIRIKDVDIPAFRDEYQRLLGSVFFYLDDSLTLCRKLHKTHRQYIVTNGVASTQRSRLSLSRLAEEMDGFFISEELGYEKPSAEFFQRSFAQIPDFRREETLIIGDSLTSDMAGGKNAGIACCWYNPSGQPMPENASFAHTIAHLWDILPILGLPAPVAP